MEGWKDDSRYAVVLEEALRDTQGNEVVPSGSLVMVEVQQMQGGAFFLRPVSIVVAGQREIPVPAGAMAVRGTNGVLLGRSVGRNRLRETLGVVGLGALESAAALANRPQSVSQVVSSGWTQQTTTFNRPDYWAAAAEGGLRRVLPRLEQELQRGSTTEIYQLDAGRPVDVYVVQTLVF
ncbi:MAG: hypothetical protein QXD60_04665 [Nanopusillaceae archaeon]